MSYAYFDIILIEMVTILKCTYQFEFEKLESW